MTNDTNDAMRVHVWRHALDWRPSHHRWRDQDKRVNRDDRKSASLGANQIQFTDDTAHPLGTPDHVFTREVAPGDAYIEAST